MNASDWVILKTIQSILPFYSIVPCDDDNHYDNDGYNGSQDGGGGEEEAKEIAREY